MRIYKYFVCFVFVMFIISGLLLILEYLYTIPVGLEINILHEFIKVLFLFLLLVANIHLWWTIDRDREYVKSNLRKFCGLSSEYSFRIGFLWIMVFSTLFIAPLVASYWYEASFDGDFVPSVYCDISYYPFYVYEHNERTTNCIHNNISCVYDNLSEIEKNVNETLNSMNVTYAEMKKVYECFNNSNYSTYIRYTNMKYCPEVLSNFEQVINNVSEINNNISNEVNQIGDEMILFNRFYIYHKHPRKNFKDKNRLNKFVLNKLDRIFINGDLNKSLLLRNINITESCAMGVSSKTNDYCSFARNSYTNFNSTYKDIPVKINADYLDTVYNDMYSSYTDMYTISTYLALTPIIINHTHKNINYVITETMESSKPFNGLLSYVILLFEIIIYSTTLIALSTFLRNFFIIANITYFLIRNLTTMTQIHLNEPKINFNPRDSDYIKCLFNIKQYLSTYTIYYVIILGLSILTYLAKKGQYVSNYIESLCITIYIFLILALFCIALRKLLTLVQHNIYNELSSVEAQIYLTHDEKIMDMLDKKRAILRDIAEDFSFRKNLLPYISGLASFATLIYIISSIAGSVS